MDTTRSAGYAPLLWGGLTAGALDITAAIVTGSTRGASATRVLQSVATGLLGRGSYEGGVPTALLGLALHFLIAMTAAAVYFFSARTQPLLARRWIIGGVLFGIAVYFFMNLVVLPLSAFPHRIVFTPVVLLRGLLIHIFCVGLPISAAAAVDQKRRTLGLQPAARSAEAVET